MTWVILTMVAWSDHSCRSACWGLVGAGAPELLNLYIVSVLSRALCHR